ncbi:hypothetical protein [Duganella qianjiadongensis]|uniref:Esterase n=1 Tax=Duganella qianjiadongensis TaxID=2692176 RepID=A0ABW9VSY4_9BURK|nr:hypothetical protein [Duganella qianjiadongensis]MYM42193.1 hypothetical protein [Duganella qianjiadongensis]
MATQKLIFKVEENTLMVMAEVRPEEITEYSKPYICCEIQAYLDKIAENMYAAKFRWNQMAKANLDLSFLNVKSESTKFRVQGDNRFAMVDPLPNNFLISDAGMSQSENSYVINEDLGSQRVTVFKGAACRTHLTKCVIIYMPDGENVGNLVHNSIVSHIDLSHFVFVGIHNSIVESNSTRIEELLFGFAPQRFSAFMKFVTSDLRKKIEGDEHPAHRFSAGYSNGGAWALDALIENPNLFDGAIAMSPAQWVLRSNEMLTDKTIFIGAGLLEPNFYEAAQSYSAALKMHGVEVNEIYVPSGHGMNTWLNIWNSALISLQPVHSQ